MKTRRATQRRIETAEGRVQQRIAEYEDLQAEFEAEVAGIVEVWDERAAAIEPVTVRLEKNDIVVSQTALVWIPRA
jgi:hypothetical protein